MQTTGSRITRVLAAAIVVVVMSGCAVKQPSSYNRSDPWETYNRNVFAFNDAVDKALLKPAAHAYKAVLPRPMQSAVRNFFSNLSDVPNTVNGLLQGNFTYAVGNFMRLLINSTFGIGGLLNVADSAGLPQHREDFGKTLAVWGLEAGPYLVIPVLGPSTARDFPGYIVDFFLNPLRLINDNATANRLLVVDIVQKRADLLDTESVILGMSPDRYAAIRNYYLARRAAFVKDEARDMMQKDDIYKDLEETPEEE